MNDILLGIGTALLLAVIIVEGMLLCGHRSSAKTTRRMHFFEKSCFTPLPSIGLLRDKNNAVGLEEPFADGEVI